MPSRLTPRAWYTSLSARSASLKLHGERCRPRARQSWLNGRWSHRLPVHQVRKGKAQRETAPGRAIAALLNRLLEREQRLVAELVGAESHPASCSGTEQERKGALFRPCS